MTHLYFKKFHSKSKAPMRMLESAGFDLCSIESKDILPRSKAIFDTGIGVILPEGTYGRVAPRSGLAVHHSIDVLAGVVDPGYRGSIRVVLFNHSDSLFSVAVGDRMAQLIVEKLETPTAIEVNELPETMRGSRGFGSTGKN